MPARPPLAPCAPLSVPPFPSLVLLRHKSNKPAWNSVGKGRLEVDVHTGDSHGNAFGMLFCSVRRWYLAGESGVVWEREPCMALWGAVLKSPESWPQAPRVRGLDETHAALLTAFSLGLQDPLHQQVQQHQPRLGMLERTGPKLSFPVTKSHRKGSAEGCLVTLLWACGSPLHHGRSTQWGYWSSGQNSSRRSRREGGVRSPLRPHPQRPNFLP